jgi:sec-independent protein translocase protein TatC
MALVGSFVPSVVDALMAPVRAALPAGKQTLIFTSAIEPMMVYIKVAIYGGVFVAAPWILLQLWRLVTPALGRRERRLAWPFVLWGTSLFYAGVAFCFWIVMPRAFPAMLAFASPGTLSPFLSLSKQLSLVLAMLLGFGIVFEMPVVIAFLAMIGLVQWRFLARYRRHAIVVNVALAAIITPTGDPLNLAMMAVPLIVFYEVGILLARLLGRPATAVGQRG